MIGVKEKWISGIYENSHARVYKVAEAIVKDVYLAEDVVQNTFEAIVRQAERLMEKDNDTVYRLVIGTAKHKAIDIYNERKKGQLFFFTEETFDRVEPDWTQDCASIVLEKEQKKEFLNRLAKLPLTYQEILIERYIHQRSEKEIAETMRLPYDLVRKRLERGRKLVKKLYDSRN